MFRNDAEALIKGTVEHLLTIRALPMNGEAFELDATDAELTFDEDWTPHIQGTLSMGVPADAELAKLDARLGCVIEVTAGYRYAKDDEDTLIMALLQLRNRSINHETDRMTLRFEGRESLFIDHVLTGSEDVSRASLTAYLQDIVGYVLLPEELETTRLYSAEKGSFARELKGDPATLTRESAELRPELGKTAWEMIAEAQRRTGTWIYSADGNNLNVDRRPEIAEKPVLTLELGESGTIKSGESNLGAEEFYNEVIFSYEWRDDNKLPAEQSVRGRAYARYGPLNVLQVRRRTYFEVIDRRVSQPEADAAARDKLARLMTKGHQYTINAVAAYWLRAGDTVALNIDGTTRRLLCKSVKFDFADGTMVVQLRTPEVSTITSNEE